MQIYLKKTPAQVFSCEICEISKNIFSTEHLRRLLLVIKNTSRTSMLVVL